MAESYWREIMQEEARIFWDKVDEIKREIWDEILPEVMQRQEPDKRLAFYGLVPFEDLAMLDPYLWRKLSDDALSLKEKERQAQFEAMRQMEREQYTERKLYQGVVRPFGLMPNSPEAVRLGLSDTLPMGTFG